MDILEPFYKDSTTILEPENDELDKGYLFLGNIKSAQPYNLGPKKINAVLTVTKESKIVYENPNIKHMKLDVEDIQNQDLLQFFDQCLKFIDENLQKGNVLVHCMAGVSRSASIVIAYIMKTKKLSFRDAFQFVKTKRTIVWPNDGFIEQLKKFEIHLNDNK
ncbi:unnamed protein product [Paramecium octaurelia]|uniref:protein-tyrosine-phosphatase n=1 Tax=Paramecium octaurelia TaxID=43137 RepID=A0A8S1UL86_PAROT|nr:unnamed protein product [Paramecium octaurelia]